MIKRDTISIPLVIFILFIEFFLGFQIGPLPISEYILWIYAIFNLKKIFSSKSKSYNYITTILILLFLLQIFIDFFIHNIDFFYIIKGSDNILMALIHTSFLVSIFNKNRKYILYALLGYSLNCLVFGPMSMRIEDTDISSALDGNNAAFLKFGIAPALSSILLSISFIPYLKNKIIPIYIYIAIILIVAGARSAGLILFVAAFLAIIKYNNFFRKYWRSVLLISTGLLYFIYCIYVNKVLDGTITSGNNSELLQVNNPYNPLELLLLSRATSYIPWVAMWKSPIFGFSTIRESNLYLDLSIINPFWSHKYFENIPCHSLIMYYGVCYGLLGFILILLFFYKILKTSFKLLNTHENKASIAFIITNIFWTALFSPSGHFKWSLPIFFAIILYLDQSYREENSYNKKTIKYVK